MTEQEQIKAAKSFARKWNGRGNEKSNTQEFWCTLLNEILDIEKPFDVIKFNQAVNVEGEDHEKEYDAIIKSTKVLIEQKSFDINLDLKEHQSGGAMLTPFEQAVRYVKGYNEKHDFSEWIKWIVVCNFQIFRIYDVRPKDSLFPNYDEKPVVTIRLRELHENLKYLKFLIDENDDALKREVKISESAAVIMREIRRVLKKSYKPNKIDDLNKLCMRLVFLFYADDSKLIDGNILEKYFENHKYSSETLNQLFGVLKQKENLRDDSLSAELKNFPYVNGGLFEEEIDIPKLDNDIDFEINRAILEGLFEDFPKFPWQKIDPPTFGAMFEGILSDNARRAEGMHYTSQENIHKIIDPLFLNELTKNFNWAKRKTPAKIDRLLALQEKLANMIFFDPACGSGNFLTETYLSLRKIENDIISELKLAGYKFPANIKDCIKVSIQQFFGIEINGYAAAVAQVALWISENKAFQRTEAVLGPEKNSGLPLSKYRQIKNANALTTDWNDVLPINQLTGKKIFIIGNPPFVGFTFQSAQQKSDLLQIFPKIKNLDYVCCWYKKASDFIQGTDIHCAFVSTNSITQGETIARFWNFLNIQIDFAYRTFKWTQDKDAEKVAAVHCVIIAFSAKRNRKTKIIYDGENIFKAKNINAYLMNAPNIIVTSRNTPLCNVPKMVYGNKPADGGKLIIELKDYDEFIEKEPRALKYIRPLLGADEFINGKKRYCLWLVNCTDEEILTMPQVAARVEKCKQMRKNSIAAGIRKFAATPKLFAQITQPEGVDYILIPRVSSEFRRYIPMAFLSSKVKVTDAVQIIPDATIYHFGILISSVHMSWTRAVCGRLESRYRYSKDIVYNNFVWCDCTGEQRAEIERTAQKILDVLAEFPDKTLAYLYDEKTMPADLRAAHSANDKAVLAAYGFSETLTESEIVAELFSRYASLTSGGGRQIADS